jgi:pantothenate kinase type III
VDAGTAMTIDAVDGTGQHLGGFIVPGPRLMVDSLLIGTSDLADRWSWDNTPDQTRFPGNTRDAIEHGCLRALAALVETALRQIEARASQPPRLVLTGGAPRADPWLPQQWNSLDRAGARRWLQPPRSNRAQGQGLAGVLIRAWPLMPARSGLSVMEEPV